MVSSRYAWPALMLLLLALLPTVTNFYRGFPPLESQLAYTLPEKFAGMKGVPTDRNKQRIKDVFHTEDWVERIYTDGLGHEITLFLGRGFDGRPLFHYPERGLLQRNWSERAHEIVLLRETHMPHKAHLLRLTGSHTNTRVLYVLLYGKESVGNPYLYLIRRIPGLIFGKRKPFTLLFVHSARRGELNEVEKPLETLLITAVDHVLTLGPKGEK